MKADHNGAADLSDSHTLIGNLGCISTTCVASLIKLLWNMFLNILHLEIVSPLRELDSQFQTFA